MNQVTQRQTKIRQPVLIDEDLAVFWFEGRDQLLRLWIKLVVQQVYDGWCKVPSIRRSRGDSRFEECQSYSVLSSDQEPRKVAFIPIGITRCYPSTQETRVTFAALKP